MAHYLNLPQIPTDQNHRFSQKSVERIVFDFGVSRCFTQKKSLIIADITEIVPQLDLFCRLETED